MKKMFQRGAAGERRYRAWSVFIAALALALLTVTTAIAGSGPHGQRVVVAAPFKTVIIDPGHGGSDRGGIPGQVVSEKDVTLDVALRLEKMLKHRHLRPVMTRTTDVDVAKGSRVALAAMYPDAVFVSIHFNSARRAGAHGLETYYNHPTSFPLAAYVHRQLVCMRPTVDRGVKKAGFYVIRENPRRSILVECGFLTNGDEALLATRASHRKKLAMQIAQGIKDYRDSL